jgi:hypothetical protein
MNESAGRLSVLPTPEDASHLRRSRPTSLATEPGTVEIVVLNNDPAQDAVIAVTAASTRSSRSSRSTRRRWSRGDPPSNQWLMLLKNEDLPNVARDFPFILGRELLVVGHRLLFSPRSLVAVPMTLRLTRETLRKRRAVKRAQRVSPKVVRGWLGDEGRAVGPAPRPRR